MKPSTGRWVSGSNFFGRKGEPKVLKERIRGGNHVLLYWQRRMGKTSIARELCRQFQDEGWVSPFAEIEAATTPEDVITEMAEVQHKACSHPLPGSTLSRNTRS